MTSRWLGPWEPIVQSVLGQPAHKDLVYRKNGLGSPLDHGFYISTGLPKFQLADYRLALRDGRGIHIREYGEVYSIHWDKVDPSVDWLGHMVQDAPKALMVMGVVAAIAGSAWAAKKGVALTL